MSFDTDKFRDPRSKSAWTVRVIQALILAVIAVTIGILAAS